MFCNPFLLDTAQRVSVLDMVISSLRDKTLENRQKGSKTLCGLLRCVLDPAETELEAFQKKFEKESTKPVGKVSRHAGVLGLVSMLQLHPYRLAAWGPRVSSAIFVMFTAEYGACSQVLAVVANHVNDPMPISGSVRTAFNEFWRTQKDNWPATKEMFAPGELDCVQDLLVSPHYFC